MNRLVKKKSNRKTLTIVLIFICIRLLSVWQCSYLKTLCFVICRENNVEILIKALERLWDTFLTSISSSVSDYLSVEHLGMILNRLKEQGKFRLIKTYFALIAYSLNDLIL